MISSYCGNSLSEVIERWKYTMCEAIKWMKEILRALVYLHSNGIIHRNLHPYNIFIDAEKKLRLSDFGNDHPVKLNDNKNESSDNSPSRYMPIEQLLHIQDEHDEKVDIWSAVTILFETISERPLFNVQSVGDLIKSQIEHCGRVDPGLLRKVISEEVRQFIEIYSSTSERRDFIEIMKSDLPSNRGIDEMAIVEHGDYLRDFINRTLQFNPDSRMSALTALSHPFLQTLHPWEQKLPTDEKEALIALEKYIRDEVSAAPINLFDNTKQ